MMGGVMPSRVLSAAVIAGCLAGLAAAQDSSASDAAKPPVAANTLPDLDQQDIAGVEIVDLQVSCNLKTPLKTTLSLTFQKNGADVTEDLATVTADRCKYLYDPEGRAHTFSLNVALDLLPTAERAAVCPNLSSAFLLRIGSASVDLPWQGKTFVLRDGPLLSPEAEGNSGHTVAMVNLLALQRATNAAPTSFASYLYADLPVYSDRDENWTKRGTFSYGLAAAAPVPEGGLFDTFGAGTATGSGQPAKPAPATTTKDIVVDLEVLGFKAACLTDDRSPSGAVLKEKP
ncbi:hypothetical protein [Tropicibacter oceani]|uniref:Uncharacterized protein n=1 Tax=Tropicibacter oceani TaxID=3058420 RepID=A0ABY8QHU7_9RHOB|nr:hypothetical protein [Tropicibacter oceani]WGW04214.1 hypothetical protein QF118_01370 [Tropicibacter oceani]